MGGELQGPAREAALAAAFVRLADTSVADFDVFELLAGLAAACVALLDVDTAGLLLDDGTGTPRVVASSTDDTHLLEVFELQIDEGPCPDCLRAHTFVTAPDLRLAHDRWPRLAPRALAAGFRAVHAVPLRLREQTVGALNLFTTAPGHLPRPDQIAAQALADVATIGIVQERAARSRQTVTEQLRVALRSRVVIEQAKGVLAERADLDMAAAFTHLRDHARRHRRRLTDVANDIVSSAGRSDLLPNTE